MYSARSLVFSLIALCLALYAGFKYTIDKTQADESMRWDRVTGVVQNSSLTHTSNRSSFTYYPHVNYQFECDGHSYLNNQIGFPNPTFSSEADATAFLANYSDGSLISVYFDKKTPAHACLRPGVGGALNGELWFGLVLAFISAVMAILPARGNGFDQYSYGYQGPQGYITPSR